MKIKNQILLSDYVLKFLIQKNVKHVPLLIGGAISFMVDAFSRNKKIKYIPVANEQSAAMIADSYSRTGAGFGCTMATSGPGATNLLTGIACSYFDSIPTMHICGQVNSYEQQGFHRSTKKVRQVGFQETDIVNISKPITKFSYKIKDPREIKYILEKAYYISTSGRPGPVLIDIPMNFQRELINPEKLKSFSPKKKPIEKIKNKIIILKSLISKSKKPVILIGGGIRCSNSHNQLKKFLENIDVPIVATWSGSDLLDHKDKRFIGNIGVYGNRVANIAIQNADLILSLGSRLDTRVTGGKPSSFGKNAKKIVVDIDNYELSKKRGLKIDLKFNYDLNYFFKEINKYDLNLNRKKWLEKITQLNHIFNFPEDKNKTYKKVNPYFFVEELSNILEKNSIIIGDTGAHLTWMMQKFKIKSGQKMFSAFGNSPMGYALPASIGAQLVNKKKKIVSLNGDGSIQLNMQELQTIKKLNLPIKVIIMNNNGYGIIQQFQDLYLKNRHEASNSVVSNPNFKLLSKTFNINYNVLRNNHDFKKLRKIINSKNAEIIEVCIKNNEKIIPKLEFGKPIDYLSPEVNLELIRKYLN
jgi:acetolactate synthase-1/2/3 large subunit